MLDASGAVIHHGGSRACYVPSIDVIHMPSRGSFTTAEGYYTTALHELVHWSGASTRCNRPLGARRDIEPYAFEELIAEMGSAFLSAHCGLPCGIYHASYIESWLTALKNDKRLVFTAAAKAQAAADYLLQRVESVPGPVVAAMAALHLPSRHLRAMEIHGPFSLYFHPENIMTTQSNYFAELDQLNVSEHLERKGGFAYLSWPYAVTQLRLADGSATWEVRRFDDKPYLSTKLGFFVEVAVTVRGITLSQIHPVLDGRNRPILAPTAFDINTSLQRCLVKAIALHGIGLYIYAGEDLPDVTTTAANDDTNADVNAAASRKGARRKTVQQAPARDAIAVEGTALADAHDGYLSVEQRAVIERLLVEVGGDLHRLLAYFGVESLGRLRAVDYDRVVRSLEKRRTA